MVSSVETIQPNIASQVKKYGDYIQEYLLVNRDWICNLQPVLGGGLQWNNHENIESGASGIVLFLIELYKQFREEKYRSALESAVNDLLLYCRNHATGNYSLYTGRAGVVYVLMQYHLLKENPELLKECIEIMKPACEQYLQTRYTTDDLYSGRSGTMLVILYLYQLTREPILLDQLYQFAAKIQSNACLLPEGICWKSDEEYNLKPVCGMAYGAAGIRYAINLLNGFCTHPALNFIIDETDRYIDSCRDNKTQNWGDFRKVILSKETLHALKTAYSENGATLFIPGNEYGWADGAAGIAIGICNGIEAPAVEMVSDQLKSSILNNPGHSTTIYNGLAGIGLFYLTLKEQSDDFELQEIIYTLSDKLLQHSTAIELNGGLFHGELGRIYFLLKVIQDEKEADHILRPRLPLQQITEPVSIQLPLRFATVLGSLLSKHYPRTMALMTQIAPDVLTDYLGCTHNAFPGNEMNKFARFIQQDVPRKIAASSNERLQDLFSLEYEVYTFRRAEKRGGLQIYLDELLQREKALRDLNKIDEWLMNRIYKISDSIKIIKSRWNWEFENDYYAVNGKQKENLNIAPAEFTYLYKIVGGEEIIEMLLGIDTLLLLQHFKKPRRIGDAFKDIRYSIFSFSEAALKNLLLSFTEYANTRDFKDQLGDMMQYEVKQWIYRDILSPVEPD